MPYNLEQGPYLSMLESLINNDPQSCLDSLRDDSKSVTALLRDRRANIVGGGDYKNSAELADHIDREWLGLRPGGDPSAATSRYWPYWHGDAENIIRETLIRAIEVALGLDHGEPVSTASHQPWYVSLLTACGIRWFEGWVSWRQIGSNAANGHVLVLLLTPSHGKPAEPTLLRPTDASPANPPGDPYVVDPHRAVGTQGLWAVGALYERRVDPEPASAQWLAPGKFPRPHLGPTYESEGKVVVVAPPEVQGGVLPGGRPYEEVS
jgi:hypothetical protein